MAIRKIVSRSIGVDVIVASDIATGAIGIGEIANDAVTADKLANSVNASIAAKLPLVGGTMTGDLTVTNATATGVLSDPSGNVRAGRKNWIINGDFQISQRGAYSSATSITSSSVYYLDRFKSKHNNISGTTVRQTNQTANGKVTNTMMLTATAGSNGRVEAVQVIEDEVFNSQTVTISAWVISNSASARLIIHQNGANIQTSSNAHTGGGAYELLKATVTCASNAGQLHIYTGIQAAGTGNVAIANGDYFKMAFLQLELGSVATDFEHRSYQEELLLCEWYFKKWLRSDSRMTDSATVATYTGIAKGVNEAFIYMPFNMRVIPTSSYNDVALHDAVGSVIDAVGSNARNAMGSFRIIVPNGLTTGDIVYLRFKSSASFMQFDAEL